MKRQFFKTLILVITIMLCNTGYSQNICGTAIGNGATVNNLANGTYAVVVTNAQGCSTTAYAEVASASNLNVTLTAHNNSCSQTNSGEVTANATGGSGFTYAWSNGGSGPTISGLANGSYTVTVTNSGGCTASTSTIVSRDVFTLIPTVGNNHCNLTDAGSIELNVSGNFYSYNWSNGSTDEYISGLGSGTYSVIVTDLIHNCSATALATVVPDNVFSGGPLTPHAFNNHCTQTNSAEINANPDNIILWTDYAWSNGGNGASITGLANGTYVVTVTDYAGCTASASKTIITDGGTLQVNPIVSNNYCTATNSAQIQANATGSTGYTYSWSNGSNADLISGLTNGYYAVTVVDYSGCTVTASTTIITENPLSLNLATLNNQCAQTNSGQIYAQAGGALSYTYAWSTGSSASAIANLANGTYTVTVTGNFHNCTVTASATVNSGNNLIVDPIVTNNCAQTSQGSIDANASGGSGFTYQWYSVTPGTQPVVSQNGQWLTSTPGISYQWMLNGADIAGATAQNYHATVTGVYTVRVTTGSGCTSVSQPVQVFATAINELTQKNLLRIYPNPSDDFIKIDVGDAERNGLTVEVFNTVGALVLKTPLAHKTDISQLVPGAYIVHVNGKQYSYNAVFIKQ